GRVPVPPARAALVATLSAGKAPDAAAPWIGLRSEEEMQARMAALMEDAATPPVAAEEVALLEAILTLAAPCPKALARVKDMARDFPALRLPAERLKARLGAMAARGIEVESLDFEASYGRTTLEYYDGFVFGFYAETRPDLPPVASGGRYDALTARLGRGASIPAVGGVIRPGLTLELRGAA
ncbi:MAG: ATP phosphoribosyltransferase regulatory subunit, partial [Paracoccaceae bacterium]